MLGAGVGQALGQVGARAEDRARSAVTTTARISRSSRDRARAPASSARRRLGQGVAVLRRVEGQRDHRTVAFDAHQGPVSAARACGRCHGSSVRGAPRAPGGPVVRCARMIETEEHRLFRKSLRDLFEREINPTSTSGSGPAGSRRTSCSPSWGRSGLLGLEYDQAYGGRAPTTASPWSPARRLGRIDCGGVPMAIAVQMAMATPALHRYGSPRAQGSASWPRRSAARWSPRSP